MNPIESSAEPSRRTAFLLLWATILVLGVNWPLNKMALDFAGPLWFSVMRAASAALVVGILQVVVAGGLRFPPRRDWPVVLSVGAGPVAAIYALMYTALQFVPPGRSSVLIWTTGLWVVPIAVVFLGERMTARRWAGLVTGIGGIVLLFEPWRFSWSDRDILLGHGLLIAGAMINAAVTVHMRGHRWASGPFEVLFWQLLLAAVLLAGVAAVLEGPPEIRWTLGLWGNLAYQAFLSSAFSVWARQTVLRRLEATPVSLMLMAVPVVGLLSSALVLGERIGPVGSAGVALVIGGVILTLGSAGSMRPGHRPPEAGLLRE